MTTQLQTMWSIHRSSITNSFILHKFLWYECPCYDMPCIFIILYGIIFHLSYKQIQLYCIIFYLYCIIRIFYYGLFRRISLVIIIVYHNGLFYLKVSKIWLSVQLYVRLTRYNNIFSEDQFQQSYCYERSKSSMLFLFGLVFLAMFYLSDNIKKMANVR